MPLPTPNEGESEQDFHSRCMANETIRADFGTQEQRNAVCYRQWDRAKGVRYGACAPICDECAAKIAPELWELTMPAAIPEPCIYCGAETKSFKEYRHEGKATNPLKAISRNDSELRVANYIVLFGGRDLEGYGSDAINADGSRGEYFTADTDLTSPYTKAGYLHVDWEHSQGELGSELLGVVDWKTAKVDNRGVFVERVLNRRNQYIQWVEGLIDQGLIGTSSEADPNGVEKAADGAITRWPLVRDTLTVAPMEPRMLTENVVQAFKALGIPVPAQDDTPEPEPETEAEPEAGTPAVSVVKALERARAQQQRIKILKEA